MCDCIKMIVETILLILLFITMVKLSSGTNIDIFQQPFASGEKEKFFISPVTNNLVNSSSFNIKCEMYQNAIMKPKVTKLGDVFNLNLQSIHTQIRNLLFTVFFMFIFFFIYSCCLTFSSSAIIYLAIFVLVLIAIFFVSFLYYFYRMIMAFYGSDMNQFTEFLNCQNVNRMGFNKYLILDNILYNFEKIIILCILIVLLNIFFKSKEKNNQENALMNDEINNIVNNL